jgi:hypothetical protein
MQSIYPAPTAPFLAKRTLCLLCSCPRRTPHDYCARRRTLHSFALCCSALGLLDSTNAMSSTAASIGPSRWFLMLRPHCVPPLPEPETARRAILLHGAAIAFTLAATIEQRRPNVHKLCSAFELAFRHSCAGAFSGTAAICWLLSRTGNINHCAAPIIHADLNRCNYAGAGTFCYSGHAAEHMLNQRKYGGACAPGVSFSGFLPTRSGT